MLHSAHPDTQAERSGRAVNGRLEEPALLRGQPGDSAERADCGEQRGFELPGLTLHFQPRSQRVNVNGGHE